MNLILKDKIPMFKVGYPTKSDKYNISGGMLSGDIAVEFGDLVKYTDSVGYYEAITNAVALDKIAGFVLATNVKLADWDGKVEVKPHEAFNLVLRGSYLAIKLDSGAKEANILPNKPVGVILATGKCTTEIVDATAPALPNVVFTGLYEKHGEDLVAEILVA